jgi:hypothetical protein
VIRGVKLRASKLIFVMSPLAGSHESRYPAMQLSARVVTLIANEIIKLRFTEVY